MLLICTWDGFWTSMFLVFDMSFRIAQLQFNAPCQIQCTQLHQGTYVDSSCKVNLAICLNWKSGGIPRIKKHRWQRRTSPYREQNHQSLPHDILLKTWEMPCPSHLKITSPLCKLDVPPVHSICQSAQQVSGTDCKFSHHN